MTSIAKVELSHALSGRVRALAIDFADVRWLRHGPRYGRPSPAMEDLADLALLIHEIDRRLPKRIVADRVRGFDLDVPLREPDRWTKGALSRLEELLYIQGNAEWRIRIGRRSVAPPAAGRDEPLGAPPSGGGAVALFSGGLDSTAGLATLRSRPNDVIAFSFYSGNLRKQREILGSLGFPRHVQVRGEFRSAGTKARAGGAFNYRAFLFLALGAVEAAAAGVATLYQFENGPLALAVPPTPLFRMTRHAHPIVQRLAGEIFSEVLQTPLYISNPFLTQTKAEAVAVLREALGSSFDAVARSTETCWYLKAVQTAGGQEKDINQPCGACVPCLVRRTAFGEKDPTGPLPLTADPIHRMNVDAYLDFAARVGSAAYTAEQFLQEAPWVTAQALLDGSSELTPEFALALYRRFAGEIQASLPGP